VKLGKPVLLELRMMEMVNGDDNWSYDQIVTTDIPTPNFL